jgi:hypothetical protein
MKQFQTNDSLLRMVEGSPYKVTFYMYSSVHIPMNCLENTILVIARHPPPLLLNNNKEEQLTPQQFL